MQGRARRLRSIETFGKRTNTWRFEQISNCDLDIQRGPDAADQSHRHQRIAVKFKEIVGNADARNAQNLGKQRAQHLLLRSTCIAPQRFGLLAWWRMEPGEHLRSFCTQWLTRRSARNLVPSDDADRDFELREPVTQKIAKRRFIKTRFRPQHYGGRDDLVESRMRDREADTIPDIIMRQQRPFDFRRRHFLPAPIDDVADPAANREMTVLVQAAKIAG